MPMENLNGRKLVEAGDLCERRNGHAIYLINIKYLWSCVKKLKWLNWVSLAGRGADLNRNWSVDWGKKEKVHYASYFLHANPISYSSYYSWMFKSYLHLHDEVFLSNIFFNYRTTIHMKRILELLLLASLKPKSCGSLPYHLILTYGLMYTLGWR